MTLAQAFKPDYQRCEGVRPIQILLLAITNAGTGGNIRLVRSE